MKSPASKSIITRSLDARENNIRNSPITEVDVTVVSDGSTDRTVELAGQYRNLVNLIAFTENRGYGAAIKEAWLQSDAEVTGFLDADGTCDPNFFANLCTTLENQHADVALGCRMNQDSKMPLLRRVGNTFLANLLRVLSSEPVRDAAGGRRVMCGAGETVPPLRWSSLHPRHERASRTRWRGPGGRDRPALPRAAGQVEPQRPPRRLSFPAGHPEGFLCEPALAASGSAGRVRPAGHRGPYGTSYSLLLGEPLRGRVDDLPLRGEPLGWEGGR